VDPVPVNIRSKTTIQQLQVGKPKFKKWVNKLLVVAKEVIESGESAGNVPPGIYAEYGYVLYEKGNFTEAILYFNKEQTKWSESKVLMAKMISNANKIAAQKEKRNEPTSDKIVPSTEVTK
jgi:hypothetical protein